MHDLIIAVPDRWLLYKVFQDATVLDLAHANHCRAVRGQLRTQQRNNFREVLQLFPINLFCIMIIAVRRKLGVPSIRAVFGIEEIFQVVKTHTHHLVRCPLRRQSQVTCGNQDRQKTVLPLHLAQISYLMSKPGYARVTGRSNGCNTLLSDTRQPGKNPTFDRQGNAV